MKVKEIAFDVILALILLYFSMYVLGGFVITKSATLKYLVWGLFLLATYGASYVRNFFLLPKVLYTNLLIQIGLLLIFFWLTTEVTGGITISRLNPSIIDFITRIIPSAKIGIFGTIATVSICIATIYQTLIWLGREK